MKNKKWASIMMVILLILSGIIVLLAMFYFTITKDKEEKIQIEDTDKTTDDKNTNSSDSIGKKEKENKNMENKEIFEIHNIPDDVFERMKGKSYKKDCKIPLGDLKYLTLSYYGYDGETHTGEMVVNALIAEDALHVFQELYEAKYPIERMELVDEYDADDIASMEANNTSAFNFRYIDGTTRYSNHAMGFAIDINPFYNPYVRYKDGEEDVLPVTAKAYSERLADCKYYIKKDDICYQIFAKYGFTWGGEWKNSKDYQHFEKTIAN